MRHKRFEKWKCTGEPQQPYLKASSATTATTRLLSQRRTSWFLMLFLAPCLEKYFTYSNSLSQTTSKIPSFQPVLPKNQPKALLKRSPSPSKYLPTNTQKSLTSHSLLPLAKRVLPLSKNLSNAHFSPQPSAPLSCFFFSQNLGKPAPTVLFTTSASLASQLPPWL